MKFPKASPEVDTVRIWFYVEKWVDLEKFFRNECKSCIASFQVEIDENGEVVKDREGKNVFNLTWEKLRADMMCSWWCKMQITVATSCTKKPVYKTWDYCRVIQVEYSVAKWHNVTNGINRGVSPSRMDILKPVFHVLASMHIDVYTHSEETWQTVLLRHMQLRRLDLSYNFKTDNVQRLMAEISCLRLNNKKGDAIVKDFQTGTVNFGGSRGSLYKAMFYDKAQEQKDFFSRCGIDNSIEQEEHKKVFYQKHKQFFENEIRFEVQYHSKYFLTHLKHEYKYKKDGATMNKIIDLCKWNYGELLRRFDEQLGMKNIRPESEYTIYSDCIDKLESLRDNGGLSNLQCANLKMFVEDCFKKSWEVVRKSMSQQTFSVKYCKVKKLTKFDLKVICVTRLPIMRIMYGDSYGFSWLNSYKILPGPVRSCVG